MNCSMMQKMDQLSEDISAERYELIKKLEGVNEIMEGVNCIVQENIELKEELSNKDNILFSYC